MATDTPATDEQELQEYGYSQELKRSLSVWSVFALGFATISPVVGIYAVAALGLLTAGPAWVWVILIALLGQLTVASVYAELASQYPVTGGVYQWVKRIVGLRAGWLTGFIYLASAIASLSTVAYLGGQWLLLLFFGEVPSALAQVSAGAVFIVIAVVINLFGVNPLKWFLNAGIIAEGIASIGIGLALLFFFRNNDLGVLFQTMGAEAFIGGGTVGAFIAALAVAGWAFLGFDATTQVTEETPNPKVGVPRALIRSFLFVGATVLLTAFAVTLSLKDLPGAVAGEVLDPVLDSVVTSFGAWSEKPFIVIVLIAFFACAVSIQTYVGRAVFGMARDRQLPGSRALSRINTHQVPYIALIVTAVLAAAGLLLGLNGNAAATLISFGSGGFYVVFLAVALTALYGRLSGRWNPKQGALRLGVWGLILNIVAVVWLAFEVVNIAWPREQFAPVGGTFVQVWAVIIIFTALLIVGLVYLLVAKPHLKHAVTAEQEER